MNSVKRNPLQLIISLGILLIGAFIYILFRPTTILIFKAFKAIGIMDTINKMREASSFIHLPGFIVNCMPNALWVTSYIILMDYLWKYKTNLTKLRWAVVIPVLGGTSELLQLMHYIPGTFDIWDFICYCVPFLVYYKYLQLK